MSGKLKSHRVSFAGHLGQKLAGIIDQPSEVPTKAWAVMAHCFTCSKDIKASVRIARGLASRGWGTLRFDFSGLGQSEGQFSESNFTTNQADLLAACDFLKEQHGAPSLLMGHSFGGIASLMTANQIESLRAVVTLAAPSDTQHLADLLLRMAPEVATEGRGKVTIGGQQFEVTSQMIEDFRRHSASSVLPQLAKPLLILHSPTDTTVHYDHAIRIYSLVTQSTWPGRTQEVSLVALPNSDHLLVQNPKDIDWVVALVDAWGERFL